MQPLEGYKIRLKGCIGVSFHSKCTKSKAPHLCIGLWLDTFYNVPTTLTMIILVMLIPAIIISRVLILRWEATSFV